MGSERVQGIDHPRTIRDYVRTVSLDFEGRACCQTRLRSSRSSYLDTPCCLVPQTHLALYCAAAGRLVTSLQLLYRARYLALLVTGEDHPQVMQVDVSET